ncbi:MAG TPA: SCO family protein [Vicinamibacteria bacterium]|nr:SCO family protein [Vicinamibacteria bacterium]
MTAAPSPRPEHRSRARTWAWGVLAAAAALLTLVAFARALLRHDAPPVIAQLPAFSLVDSGGRAVTADDLRGKAWVADFIFTRCGGACPTLTARMAALRRDMPPDVAFVSITVDPAHDTPEVLAAYARRAGAESNWLFLTGERDALYRLALEGFKLGVEEVPPERQAAGDGPFLHSSHFVLVDGRGRVRGYYDSTEEEARQRLRRDLQAVRKERA